jgi:hypothetical protein
MNRLGVIFAVGCLVSAAAAADVITMRNGQTIYGTYIGGNARQLRLDVGGGQIQTFDIGQVQSISFGDSGSPNSAAPVYSAPPAGAPPQYAPAGPPPQYAAAPPPPPSTSGVTIPADTRVTIRMIDAVDSDTARLGQTYRASLDEPIEVNGQVLVPRGADVLTKLVQDQQSGKIQGRTALTLALVNISINGQRVDVTSTDVTQQSGSQGSKSAKVIGGTAALGTIIGALAGGGKGAAIGAVSGAGAGGAVQVLTSGQRVRIPSETRLTFRLQNPVQL